MRSIYIGKLVRPIAAPLGVRIHSYERGVAIVRIYPYPALGGGGGAPKPKAKKRKPSIRINFSKKTV